MSRMTAEEFLEKHRSILREALDVYMSRMESNAGDMEDMARNFPENRVYKQMSEDFFSQRTRAKAASEDLWKMTDR